MRPPAVLFLFLSPVSAWSAKFRGFIKSDLVEFVEQGARNLELCVPLDVIAPKENSKFIIKSLDWTPVNHLDDVTAESSGGDIRIALFTDKECKTHGVNVEKTGFNRVPPQPIEAYMLRYVPLEKGGP
jgi:hypothetical protein